ncbi:uncharacterized protein LOC141863512 isoform X1 [Acropora palmata]|uniref:uncharacterized protein LOC141863512 isoform X1 n=1 Tax=Acropora palmata TaxID=6131 RepID=UPI003DA0995B
MGVEKLDTYQGIAPKRKAVYTKPKWLPVVALQIFPMRKLWNLTLVQFLSQPNMQYGVKIFKDECYNCGQKGHLQRDCPDMDSKGFSRSDPTCYKCGKEGHFQRNCTENGFGDAPSVRCYHCGKSGHFARDCQDDSSSDTLCYRCNKRGHFARECPSSDQICYSCGKSGHLKRDCTENDVTCYKCNEIGHFARDCPTNEE